jgi:hypothetical protein
MPLGKGIDSRLLEVAMFWRLAALILLLDRLALAQAPPARKIIDVHMHAETNDPRFGSRFTNPLTGLTITASPDEPTHIASSIAMMKRLNVVKLWSAATFRKLSTAGATASQIR